MYIYNIYTLMYTPINFVTKTYVLSNKNFNNNTTNFGSKSASFDLLTTSDQKLFNNWFNGNTTNFGPSHKSYPLNNFYYRPV